MFVIMSTDRTGKSTSVNAANRAQFKKYLEKEKYEFSLGKGSFNGVEEQSFVIELGSGTQSQLDDLFVLEHFGTLYEQDTILIVSADQGISENLHTGEQTYIGEMVTHLSKPEGDYTEINEGLFVTFEE